MFYYIHDDEFITTDVALAVGEYEVGELKLEDYQNGKYILLNEDLVRFMKENKDASPLEVFLQRFLTVSDDHGSPASEAYTWFSLNLEYLLINGNKYQLFDWRYVLEEARVFRELGEETMTFSIWGSLFEGTPDEVYLFLLRFAKFHIDLDRVKENYYRFIEAHPDKIDEYDYKLSVPEIVSVNFKQLR